MRKTFLQTHQCFPMQETSPKKWKNESILNKLKHGYSYTFMLSVLEMLFPGFSKSYLCISRIIYLVHCLSKPMHIQSITLATSITKQKTDYLCILQPANVLPLRVIIVSSQLLNCLSCLEANGDFIARSFFENFPNRCLVIFYFKHSIQVYFYFLGKKLGGTRAPRPLPLL